MNLGNDLDLLHSILRALIIFLPAGVANMAPVFANKVPGLNRLNTPVDFGHTFRGKRLLGNHKTWRGIITGTFCGALAGVLLFHVFKISIVPKNHLLFATCMSFGALFGDALKSFFKRQVGVASGKSWFPFDQTDYIIGGIVFMLPFGHIPLSVFGLIFVLYFGLHLLVSYLGFLVHLKDAPI